MLECRPRSSRTSDFLTAAYRIGREFDPNYAQSVWGSDNSINAVQVAVLNMLLHGDGKANIKHEDSLANVKRYENTCEILVCNPQFGTRIVEKKPKTLELFSMGHAWSIGTDGKCEQTQHLLDAQETGMLFVEACVVQAQPGGRIGIIVPNGYLGNRSIKYVAFREWLLRHCRIASICSFPRVHLQDKRGGCQRQRTLP